MQIVARCDLLSRHTRSGLATCAEAIRGVAVWWFGEILSLMPQRLRRPERTRIELHPAGRTGRIVVFDRSKATEGLLRERAIHPGGFGGILEKAKRKGPVLLILPEHLVLRREIRVPQSAGSRFQSLYQRELSRWTPFEPDELLAACRMRSEQGKLVEFELRYSTKRDVLDAAAPFCAAGLVPGFVILGDEFGFQIRTKLFHKQVREPLGFRQKTAVLALAASLLLAIICEFVAANRELNFWREQLRLELAKMHHIKKLEDRLSDVTGSVGSSALSSMSRTRLLSKLSAILPSSDRFTEINLRGNTVSIRGYAAKPDELIKAMEPLAAYRSIRMQEGVATEKASERKQFSYSFELADTRE